MADDRHLRAALGTYPRTRALKTGALSNADVTFDFVEGRADSQGIRTDGAAGGL